MPTNKTVQVNVTGGQTNYTADLSSLADGPRSTRCCRSGDPGGQSLQPPAAKHGDASTRTRNEHPSMSVKRRLGDDF